MVVLHPKINVFVAVSMMALQPSLLSYTVFPSSTVMLAKESHEEKASSPMLVTPLGMVMLFNSPHRQKASFLISVKLSGNSTLTTLEQL